MLSAKMVSIERGLLLMQEKLGFIYSNSHSIRLSDESEKEVEYFKQEIKKNLKCTLLLLKDTFREETYEHVNNCLNSAKKNIRELVKEVLVSTYYDNCKSVCHIMEEEVEQMGVASERDEFKFTGDDEPITQEVFDQDYDLCAMNVQSINKIKNIERNIRNMHK